MWVCVFIIVYFNILIKQDLIYIDMYEIRKSFFDLIVLGFVCVGCKFIWIVVDVGIIQVNIGQLQIYVDCGVIIESFGDLEWGYEVDEFYGQVEDGQDKGYLFVDGIVCEQ